MERTDYPSSSALDRLVKCTASHNMGILASQWQEHEGRPSEDAEFGTRVHGALQRESAKGLQSDEERMAFSVMNRQRHIFVTGWRNAHRVAVCQELFEHRMWLHHGVTPVFSGQADYILISGTNALILDYKSLWNKVPEPVENHQLKSLAVLLWLSHRELKSITIQIIASHHDYVHHTMDEQDLRDYLDFLESTVKLVNQASVPVPGEWCKYCRGLLICPAIRKKASDLIKSDEDGLIASRLPKGEAGSKILDDLAAVSTFIDKVRDHYRSLLTDEPKALPGWSLQQNTRRKFKNTQHVFNMLRDKWGEAVFDVVDISVSKTFAGLNSIEQAALTEYVETSKISPSLRKGKDRNGNQEK